MTIYFHVGTHADKDVELGVKESYGSIGVYWDGKTVGSVPVHEVQTLFQYLVNNNHIDLDEVAEGKRIKDSGCTCHDGYKPACSVHFATG